jgi:hypothetical protein
VGYVLYAEFRDKLGSIFTALYFSDGMLSWVIWVVVKWGMFCYYNPTQHTIVEV